MDKSTANDPLSKPGLQAEQSPKDETDIIMEAAGKIREILRPLKDYQQQTALAVAKELETHARVLRTKARQDSQFAAFEASRQSTLASETQPSQVGQ